MAERKKRLLTGIQSSGQLHIGNYLGALKPFVEKYEEYESMLMVADYHALTSLKDPALLSQNIIEVVSDYIAAGVNPAKAIIFKQSDVPEHTELACLFTYPMLMAADILLYNTDVVPVGEDQRQHIEYAREAAAKFNNAYGETFKEPAEQIMASIGTIPGVDGKKMSKSYGNTIPLFGTDAEIRTAVMGIKTDSTAVGQPLNPESDIAFQLHRHFTSNVPELDKRYREGSIGYKESKELLAENIIAAIAPMRERRNALSREAVIQILKDGAEAARAQASEKMKLVREKIGVGLY